MLLIALLKTGRPLSMAKKLFLYLSCIDLITASRSLIQLMLIWYARDYPCYISNIANLVINRSQDFEIFIFSTISILCYLSLRKSLLHMTNCIIYRRIFLELICAIIYGFIVFFLIRPSLNTRIFTITIYCILLVNIISFTKIKKSYSAKVLSNDNQHQRNQPESVSNSVQNQKDTISIDLNIQSERSHKRKKDAVNNLILTKVTTIFYLICNFPPTLYILAGLI